MTYPDDHQLLATFARDHSESAFAALVSRHLNLVYSVALRTVGNTHAAQEISQAVFIILARKADKLSRHAVLSGWLYQTTRLTAANFLRGEIRRQQREQEAHMQSTLNEPEANVWQQIAPLLDDALGKLGERDRNAIVLRFFENKSLQEVGVAMGASEDAAKMRVNRALEKLRKIFGKRGVTLSATLIAGAVSAGSVQAAPPTLAKAVMAIAITKGAGASVSTLTLIKGALKIMSWTKIKVLGVIGGGIILAVGTTAVVIDRLAERSVDDSYWDMNSPGFDEKILKAPPVLVIRPTHFHQEDGYQSCQFSFGKEARLAGRAGPFEWLLQNAFGSSTNADNWPATRMICPTNLLGGKYDFLVTVPDPKPRFQREIKRQFGVTGHFEICETNVYLLKIKNGSGKGLKPGTPTSAAHFSRRESGSEKYYVENGSVLEFVKSLEERLQQPVLDQTGLTGRYDIDLKWNAQEADWKRPKYENLKQALTDQLGLELVPSREPIEMLVVEKAN